MQKKIIHTNQLKEYIEVAFYKDYDLLQYYDKGENITTLSEVTQNVYEKLTKNYPDAILYGIDIQDFPVGFFVYSGTLLVSFGLDVHFRNKENLSEFWSIIKETIGESFQSILYSYNDRAIGFLKKGGMDIIFENVTILQYN